MPVTLCGLREVEIQIKGQERRVADHTAQRRPETAAAPDGERCASGYEQHDVQCVEGNTASPPERLPQHPEEISRTRKVGGAEVAIGQLTSVPRVRHGGEHVVIGPQRPGQVMRDPGCELQQREADKRPRQVSSENSVRQELAGRQRCGVISPRHLVVSRSIPDGVPRQSREPQEHAHSGRRVVEVQILSSAPTFAHDPREGCPAVFRNHTLSPLAQLNGCV